MMLVTLAEAKNHLRVEQDDTDQDADISAKVLEASASVLTYLKGAPIGAVERDAQGAIVRDSNGDPTYQYDSNGALIVRPEVQAATLLLVGEYYKHREAEQAGEVPTQWGYGYLPRPVVAILYPLRDPAVS